jgi:hypothetical protein
MSHDGMLAGKLHPFPVSEDSKKGKDASFLLQWKEFGDMVMMIMGDADLFVEQNRGKMGFWLDETRKTSGLAISVYLVLLALFYSISFNSLVL